MSARRRSAAAAEEVASVSSLSARRAKRNRAADDQGRRAVAYVRESTEEQGRGYSPDGQRQAISRYAAEHGRDLIDEYLDFDTGRAAEARGPAADRGTMEHRFECVLIFHTPRFARNTVEAKRYKKLLRSELGIDVISVTQPLGTDVDDPPRSSPSPSTRSSPSTTPSRSPSGRRWGCARKPVKDA